MNENDVQSAINEVKAQSFDQITAMNMQIQQLSNQIQQQNQILQQVVAMVSPEDPNLTVEQLLGKLQQVLNQFKEVEPDVGSEEG